MPTHAVFRQVGYIQQSLSQNKKQIGFFIGAGCPLSIRVSHTDGEGNVTDGPLIPDVAGLTKCIHEQLYSVDDAKPSTWDKIISMIAEDGGSTSNIEHILTQVRLLGSVAGKGEARGLKLEELTALDEEICKIISKEVDKPLPDQDSPYHNLAIWTRSIKRDQPVHIFTTNYDLLIEQAFEESAAPYFDGFIGARKAFFDLGAVEDEELLPARWSRLWKVHGSLNWRLVNGKDVIRSDIQDDTHCHLIYPSHLKYDQSRKMPYLAMLDRLKEFLLKPSAVLFMSGYSFGDEHINDIICRTLETNPTAQVFSFLFGSLSADPYKNAKSCAMRTPNLSILAFDRAIIGRTEGEWEMSEDPFKLPAGIVVSPVGEAICELKLGDFLQFGNLLRNLTLGTEDNGN
ncbi:SIR2 family protein [Asticcacaulis sp. 201]|uniref:SIR2 family NAD-dependent protein deacylase n=1 Tax=Asticcacaulis sp. 201 TaxID=3028787 RepID=UPI0029164CAC|nr:SIR2 family protein [Asticcacaulis sp. 201]MDV6333142.1 SIR2 family protein [Asticcacaulis sp. 201]